MMEVLVFGIVFCLFYIDFSSESTAKKQLAIQEQILKELKRLK